MTCPDRTRERSEQFERALMVTIRVIATLVTVLSKFPFILLWVFNKLVGIPEWS
jgi:hypothetical protein